MTKPRLSLLLLSCYLLSLFTASMAQSNNSYVFIVGDFNGDGLDDYVRRRTGDWATNDEDGNAELFLAQQGGQFKNSTLPAGFDIRTDNVTLYVGDFNGDGIEDILRQETGDWVPDYTNTAYLLLADGNGGFTKNVLSEDFELGDDAVDKLWIADFNGDGKDDILRLEKDIDRPDLGISSHGITNILLAVDSDHGFFVAINPDPAIDLSSLTPQGTFASRQVASFVGNFAAQSYADVIRFTSVTGMQYTGTIFFTNMYGGYFREVNITNELGYGGYFHVGDFNGDGRDDFIQGGSGLDENQLFLSTSAGDGTFDAKQLSADLKLDTEDLLIGDFNGDGNADILSIGDKVQVYLSTGDDFEIVNQSFASTSVFALGDFNGDNMTDVLEYVKAEEEGTVTIHLSNGDGSFSE